MKKFIPPIENLYGYIEKLAATQGDKVMLSQHDRVGQVVKEMTYAQFKESIELVGKWFVYKGLEPGDRIALNFTNSIELLVVSWAAWSYGVVSVPLDTKRDTEDDMRYKIELTDAKMVLDPENFNFDIVEKDLSNLAELRKVEWKTDLAHEALILFTSGTTGRAKGASLSLQNLIANGDGIREWFSITSEDRFMVILPLHHINSTSFCFASLLGGASIAIPPKYSASNFWSQVMYTGATFTSIVPTICYDQLSFVSEFAKFQEDIKLNRIQIGSAPVKPSDVKKFMNLYNIKLYQGYGQTETALRVTGVPHNTPEELYKKLVQENAIGVPMKWATVAVLGQDGNELSEGEEGELAVKGPIVMKGYLGGERAFNEDGWFMTGDLAYFKNLQMSDGQMQKIYYLKGRLKEIIIKGGVNVSPAAVEDKLKQIEPNIDKVCVVGIPDERYGEEIIAAIVWSTDATASVPAMETEFKRKLSSKSALISDFEKPAYILSITEDQIPMTSTRKVQRSVLAEQINPDELQPILQIATNDTYIFQRLQASNKHLMAQTLELYNTCWAPLTLDMTTFQKYVKNGTVIIALEGRKVRGFVTVLRTGKPTDELMKLDYTTLTASQTLTTNENTGDKIICIAIGSDNYTPEEISELSEITPPTEEEVQKYLEEGLDYVYRFHTRPKGGLNSGANLIKILPNTRPDDQLALGYNMLMKYPILPETCITPDSSRSIGVQLIEAAMSYAQQCGVKDVYAFSRPAGLRAYVMESLK